MNIESLYPLVSESILRAELLEEAKSPQANAAHLEVSRLEEKIAEKIPASDPEGAISRRGAVRAALAGGDIARAENLAKRFAGDRDASPDLKAELARLLRESADRCCAPA